MTAADVVTGISAGADPGGGTGSGMARGAALAAPIVACKCEYAAALCNVIFPDIPLCRSAAAAPVTDVDGAVKND
jgi:hypothetical protein